MSGVDGFQRVKVRTHRISADVSVHWKQGNPKLSPAQSTADADLLYHSHEHAVDNQVLQEFNHTIY